MKITAIDQQTRDQNRVNVYIDGEYRFSLDISQLTELGIKVGNDYEPLEIKTFEDESNFGKLYVRTLNYCLIRSRSSKEVKDYLHRKLNAKDDKYSQASADKVYERLCQKGYIDDKKFATFWVNNRFQKKGISARRLRMELLKKGVAKSLIDLAIGDSERNDADEIKKIIAKKSDRYDNKKLAAYLVRQGFSYDLVKDNLTEIEG